MSRPEQAFLEGIDDDFKQVVQQLIDLFVHVAKDIQHGRGTHTTGIAARGVAQIITPIDFPANDFLSPGKTYPVVVRHATPGPQTDDRMLDGGAISIKFLDHDDTTGVGFHDLMMNTGRVMFVPSARAFNTMVHTPFQPGVSKGATRRPLIEQGIIDDDKLTEGYRTGSYTEFYYHSQIVFEFTDTTGTLRYIRFRSIPGDRGPERGFFPPSIRALGETFSPAWPDDQRAADYRRRDFEVRVNHLAVNYLLQAQIRPANDPEALNPMVYWEERIYPWLDIAELRLNKTLTFEEMDALSFDANRTHDSINLPLAKTADDHASLGHARALIYWHARKARAESPQPHKV